MSDAIAFTAPDPAPEPGKPEAVEVVKPALAKTAPKAGKYQPYRLGKSECP